MPSIPVFKGLYAFGPDDVKLRYIIILKGPDERIRVYALSTCRRNGFYLTFTPSQFNPKLPSKNAGLVSYACPANLQTLIILPQVASYVDLPQEH